MLGNLSAASNPIFGNAFLLAHFASGISVKASEKMRGPLCLWIVYRLLAYLSSLLALGFYFHHSIHSFGLVPWAIFPLSGFGVVPTFTSVGHSATVQRDPVAPRLDPILAAE